LTEFIVVVSRFKRQREGDDNIHKPGAELSNPINIGLWACIFELMSFLDDTMKGSGVVAPASLSQVQQPNTNQYRSKLRRRVCKRSQNSNYRPKPIHDELPLLESHYDLLREWRRDNKKRKPNRLETMIQLIREREGSSHVESQANKTSPTSGPIYSGTPLEHFVIKRRSIRALFRLVSSPKQASNRHVWSI